MTYNYKVDIPEEVQELYRKGLEKWGIVSLIDQVIEEMAELTVKLQHLKRNNKGVTIEQVAEEAADVKIVIDRLFSAYIGIWEGEEWLDKKVDKLKEQLNK
ncbi:hypothetical protein H6G33_10225 [Calothrix sp. FACHB-1219]|uniref:hypothetical protein n=1 Tax=unclassified Calothrix TaxID=2619626 RepID=UPI00168648ED|nr:MULTISPECIES: hypothetical protein [unclassified Calothrix]MBD2201723.1 hypothetical protein [Calothrix sp. FACHB-168]MBD2217409.1 hypothetical protein [Calothrix sp. FACHB-1219]